MENTREENTNSISEWLNNDENFYLDIIRLATRLSGRKAISINTFAAAIKDYVISSGFSFDEADLYDADYVEIAEEFEQFI